MCAPEVRADAGFSHLLANSRALETAFALFVPFAPAVQWAVQGLLVNVLCPRLVDHRHA